MPEVQVVSPLVGGSALVVRGVASRAITVAGIDPALYYRIVTLPDKIVHGTADLTGSEILVGTELATDLGVAVGDRLRPVSYTHLDVYKRQHCGRVAHVANMPAGTEVLGPGTAACPGEMYTDTLGMQPHSPPRAMTDDDLLHVIDEHVAAAKLAMDAGFDGVELHGANGYLIEQFLNPLVNQRTDGYGGSNERRNRLALEIARATVAAIGRDRVGMRLSPYGVFNGTGAFPEVQAQYLTLVHSLSALGLLYLHLVDHSSMGAPPVPADFKLKLRDGFDGLFILSGGFDHASAEQALLDKRGDLIAFGRPFLANPDLVDRMRKDAPLNAPDEATFYVPGAKGYTDYPALVA